MQVFYDLSTAVYSLYTHHGISRHQNACSLKADGWEKPVLQKIPAKFWSVSEIKNVDSREISIISHNVTMKCHTTWQDSFRINTLHERDSTKRLISFPSIGYEKWKRYHNFCQLIVRCPRYIFRLSDRLT